MRLVYVLLRAGRGAARSVVGTVLATLRLLRLTLGPSLLALRRVRFRSEPSSDVIISLTSFPDRVGSLWATVDSLFNQDAPLKAIVLVLSDEEFPHRHIPRSLHRRVRRGLTLVWVSVDRKNFDKLLPSVARFPTDRVITVDDDKLYDRGMAGALIRASDAAPGAVVGTCGRIFSLSQSRTICMGPILESQTHSPALYLLNGTGVIYPPGSLHWQANDFELIAGLSATSDDVWFWVMSLQAGTKRICLGKSKPEPNIRQRKTATLQSVNRFTKPAQVLASFEYFDLLHHLADSS